MPTALPAKTILNGADNPTTSQMKTALGQLHDNLSEDQARTAGLVNGVLTTAAGTAAAPSLTTTGDTNTGLYFPAADTVAIATGGVKRVEVDANGNVGVGITPSAWGAYNKVLQVRNAALSNNDTVDAVLSLSNNCYRDNASGWKYNNSGFAATLYQQGFTNSGHYWYTAPSGTAGNPITFTQAMTLGASGNLLVGATIDDGSSKLQLSRNGECRIMLQNTATPSTLQVGCDGTGGYAFVQQALPYSIYTNSAERARIDSSGNLLVNRTSRLNNGKIEALASTSEQAFVAQVQTNTNALFQGFNASGSATFYVIGSGGIYSTSTTITAISDVSQKENIRPIEYGIAEVCALNPVKFDFKKGCGSEEKDLLGFVAQDVEPVIPELVKPFGDDGLKGLKTGDMIPVLVKAIQEQQALIEAQKTAIESLIARITALEAK